MREIEVYFMSLVKEIYPTLQDGERLISKMLVFLVSASRLISMHYLMVLQTQNLYSDMFVRVHQASHDL